MTDLTQDWKDGKLSAGWYYVKFPDTEVEICGIYKLCAFRLSSYSDKIKILAEVPDYTTWQNVLKTAEVEHIDEELKNDRKSNNNL